MRPLFTTARDDDHARTAPPSRRPATKPSTPHAFGPRTASSRDRAGGSDSRRSWAAGSATRRRPTSSGACDAPRKRATASSPISAASLQDPAGGRAGRDQGTAAAERQAHRGTARRHHRVLRAAARGRIRWTSRPRRCASDSPGSTSTSRSRCSRPSCWRAGRRRYLQSRPRSRTSPGRRSMRTRSRRNIHAQLDNFDSDEAAMLKSLEGLSAFEGALRAQRVPRDVRRRHGLGDVPGLRLRRIRPGDAASRRQGRGCGCRGAGLTPSASSTPTRRPSWTCCAAGPWKRSSRSAPSTCGATARALNQALLDNLDKGNEQDQAKALMDGDTDIADAIAIDEAMRGGLTGWGTDEEDIEATYKRVHDEVLALAQREGWSSEQMKAEVRRRIAPHREGFRDPLQGCRAVQRARTRGAEPCCGARSRARWTRAPSAISPTRSPTTTWSRRTRRASKSSARESGPATRPSTRS